jgi:hypothetical protein
MGNLGSHDMLLGKEAWERESYQPPRPLNAGRIWRSWVGRSCSFCDAGSDYSTVVEVRSSWDVPDDSAATVLVTHKTWSTNPTVTCPGIPSSFTPRQVVKAFNSPDSLQSFDLWERKLAK